MVLLPPVPPDSPIEAEADELGEHIRTGARALVDPSTADVFDHVYVTTPPDLIRQRAEFASFLASSDGEGA